MSLIFALDRDGRAGPRRLKDSGNPSHLEGNVIGLSFLARKFIHAFGSVHD